MPSLTMRYRSILTNALDSNTIRFATATSFGHRVSVDVPLGDLADIFGWTRTEGESVPSGTVNASLFQSLIGELLTSAYDDKDKNINGLDFSSTVMDSLQAINPNVRAEVTQGGSTTRPKSVNDLVMAYLLFRCFGKTNYAEIGEIYNLEDAHNMTTNDLIATMFYESLNSAEGDIQASNILRDQLSNDPSRYISGSTAPPGLFNTGSTDVSGSGDMVFLVGDIIEFPVRLVFTAPVSVASIPDDTVYASGTGQAVGTTDRQVIQGEASNWDPATATSLPTRSNILAFRLHLTVVADP